MSNDHELPPEDLAAYALGVLDPADRVRVELHLRYCAECTRRVEHYQTVADTLPYGLPAEAPPPQLRAALIARARSGAASSVATAIRPPAPSAGGRLAQLSRPLLWAAAAAAVAGLVFWNIQLQQQVARLQQTVTIQPLVSLPEGRIIALVGTGVPRARARLFVTSDGSRGELAIIGLPALSADRIYQLWFARPDHPTVTGGAFRVNARGEAVAVVVIPAPLEEVRAIAVTEEPAPGSPGPTGRHLLDGRP